VTKASTRCGSRINPSRKNGLACNGSHKPGLTPSASVGNLPNYRPWRIRRRVCPFLK